MHNQEIKTNPNNAKAYYNRGNVNEQLHNYQEAIADYTKAIELVETNDSGSYYYFRGNIKNKIQDYQGAIADYTKAIELYPVAGSYLGRGLAYQGLEKKSQAEKDFQTAKELVLKDDE